MSFQVSARRWRPQTFDEVIGQRHLVQLLSHAVVQGKTAHAYLFSGMRGVGKTSVARILAKALNCADSGRRPCNQCISCQEITEDRSMDVMQIDGASNTSVDDVRELREVVKYLPLRGRHRIVIIDEVHMLSNAAFNALLKTLEEPPPHLVFILATTEAHKIPDTILSRCQHFIFRRILRADLDAQLKKILLEKKAQISDPVLAFIAKASEGSLRDALSLLDQAIAFGGQNITEETLSILFGRVAKTVFHALVCCIQKKDAEGMLKIAREIENGGYDLRHFLLDWIEHLRNMLVIKHVPNGTSLIDLSDEERKEIEEEGRLFSEEEIHRLFSLFIKLLEEIRNAPRPHLLFEVALLKSILLANMEPIEKIIAQLVAVRGANESQVSSRPLIAPRTAVSERVEVEESLHRTKTISSIDAPDTTKQIGEATTPASPPRPTEAVRSLPAQGWEALLKEVKRDRPPLASYLSQGKLLSIEEQTIHLGFLGEASFVIPLIQKEENKKWLRALFKRYFEREMQIISVPITDSIVSKTQSTAAPSDHPLVLEALKVFAGAVIKTEENHEYE